MPFTPKNPSLDNAAVSARHADALLRAKAAREALASLQGARRVRAGLEAQSLEPLPSTSTAVVEEERARVLAQRALESCCARAVSDEFELYERQTALNEAEYTGVNRGQVGPIFSDGAAPVALLPVRVETRFVPDPTDPSTPKRRVLRVRIYPDEIFAETFEPRLRVRGELDPPELRDEAEDGKNYWTQVRKPEPDEPSAWRSLLDRGYSAARAAWIVEATRSDAAFKAAGTRRRDWLRPPEAHLLPDRWVVIGYQRATLGDDASELVEVFRVPTSAILRPLPLGTDLTARSLAADPDHPDDPTRPLPVDPGAAWTIDFAAAVKAGMAVEITEDSAHRPFSFKDGLDLLTVVGVRTLVPPAEASPELGRLLQQHRYTRGVAPLAPDTPTNNTTSGTAAWHSMKDRRGETLSFLRERERKTAQESSDGHRLLKALGLGAEQINSLADLTLTGANSEVIQGLQVRYALFPATLGYALDHLIKDNAGRGHSFWDDGLSFFYNCVRPGGSYTPIRVGRNPYGVLPVTRFPAAPAGRTGPASLAELLGLLVPVWRRAATGVPHVGRPGAESDPEGELLAILGMEARSHTLGLRNRGWQEHAPPLGKLESADDGWSPERAVRRWQASLTGLVYQLIAENPGDGLLELLLRIWPELYDSTDSVARHLEKVKGQSATFSLLRHPLLWQIGDGAHVPDFAPSSSLFAKLVERGKAVLNNIRPEESRTQAQKKWLTTFPHNAPTDESALTRHMLQTFDACSHRLDAWLTGLANERLSARVAMSSQGGCFIGGYGWVQHLRPDSETSPPQQAASHGYIHAPSPAHAAAAAVLRSAYTSEDPELNASYAIDLNGERARRARRILDGVRHGQRLEALLGYQLERALHDQGLNVRIETLRRGWPMEAKRVDGDAREDTVNPPVDVVNGLALIKEWRKAPNHLLLTGLDPHLRALDDTLDAVHDLLLAESTFQMVRGNRAATAATLDVLASGAVPPDPGVLRTPCSGRVIHQRVVLPLPDGVAPAGWPETARAKVEPSLNAWLANLLGDPGAYVARISPATRQDGGPTAQWMRLDQLNLAPLDLLDVARQPERLSALARARVLSNPDWARCKGIEVELDPLEALPSGAARGWADALEIAAAAAELLGHARPLKPSDLVAVGASADWSEDQATAAITRAEDAWNEATWILNMLRHIPEARSPDRSEHLGISPVLPPSGPFVSPADQIVALRQWLIDARAWAWAPQHGDPRSRWTLAEAMARHGIPLPTPPVLPVADESERAADLELLVSRSAAELGRFADELDGATDELARRVALAGQAFYRAEDLAGKSPSAAITAANEVISALFGAQFKVTEAVTPPQQHTLNVSALELEAWVHEAARARPPLATLQRLRLYTEAASATTPWSMTALSGEDKSATWLRGPVPAARAHPWSAPGPSTFVAWAAPRPSTGCRGLLLDAWVERQPDSAVDTGLAFHYDDPGAEAPQAILMAVPPANKTCWTFDDLAATVRDSFELARIRGVTPDQLGHLAQALPLLQVGVEDDPSGVNSTTMFDSPTSGGSS